MQKVQAFQWVNQTRADDRADRLVCARCIVEWNVSQLMQDIAKRCKVSKERRNNREVCHT